ncbi:ParA family protein [Bacteriovorax sp. Seq25_V]|uniref:ParA family protein n=1 Tax=Bacteriovorax sp. Seq25_V TaxID=1201288 RepID=UPI00038A4D63|nr:ParA family protein [Bacteriovorax sp. Seq25_V]EQC47489.1 CobQ/CobB/MinD/ParA nucleotide binding domain protein [Bacteriovorax sp. Seq25_V]
MEVITVANNKGGVGKTMQCFQLACHLANKGNKVLVIDLDSQANLSSTFNLHIQRTLIPEWLIGDVSINEVMVPSEGKGKFNRNITVIPSSRHMANLSKLLILSEGEIRKEVGRKERLMRTRLQEAEGMFDYVIIDTPPMLGDELIMALVASNRILIPTQAQDYSIDGLEELMDTFEIIKETENPVLEFSIIPSMVNTRRKIEQQRLEELSQSFDITPPVRNLVQMQESISMKRPVCLMGKKSRGRVDYENLWNTLNLN